eukprot:NODE_7378_length_1584_cov_15.706932.p1 GENE.NODE_7378_length_1584_cov_15.706932~~NODE_7378_length_1584_cov_15.706932.p1  ORF type:complete len:372 (-),score=104.57 NODE_7378_length_1584_cov_15.706932:376-1491(-)
MVVVQKPWVQKQGKGAALGKAKATAPKVAVAAKVMKTPLKTKAAAKGGKANSGSKPSGVPADFKFDGSARYSGTVGAYWKFRGCGFIDVAEKGIVPGNKLFVFWKSIQSDDRFPSLTKGQEVEFGIQLKKRDGQRTLVAKTVTLPGGGNVALQDEVDAEKKTFIGGQYLRYTGTLKFFSPRNGFGYVLLDEGYALDASVPKELRVETAEVNAGGKQPRVMKDLQVEFGIWQTKKGQHKVYNMTLPGGLPVAQEALENRTIIPGRTFKGKVEMFMWRQGFGFILPDAPGSLPQNVKTKLAQMAAAAKTKGKEVQNPNLVYFRKPDVQRGVRVEKGGAVTFQIYTDDKGAGACEIVASGAPAVMGGVRAKMEN